jgi:putative DNA primase/helicase
MIFDGDPELIRYVQQLLGYSLTGDTGEHILPIAYGSGCNGKSTIWNAVLSLLGDYGGLANDSLLMGVKDTHPTEKAFLYQKRFVPISEPEQSARLRESRVKELTGDGTITARRMHEDFWSFTRTHTFWLSTNHLPRITGNDDGIWRRVKLIPFTVDLRKVTTPIPDLDKQLVTEEGPGILNWLIAGYLDYRRNGFIEPEVIKVATNGYRDQEDEIAMFIADRCVTGNQFVVPASALFDAYFKWGGKENRTMFGKAIGERFAKQIRSSGVYRKQTVYEGVGLSSESDDF